MNLLSHTDATPQTLTVSELSYLVNSVLERHFPLVWISGEVSAITFATSGHWYFTIKDEKAQLRCVMFRHKAQYAPFQPQIGNHIEVRALVSMYTPRGEIQLNVDTIRHAGQGRLYEIFLETKARLKAEGLFDTQNKQSIARYPQSIGIITSLQAAALQDVLITLQRRAPHIAIYIYPTQVQGKGTAEQIIKQIERANRECRVDSLIICRGGGSIEDLWAFNEEKLARAIYASKLAIITGIGHETDFTIADFVADARAATPTAAAELASPERQIELENLFKKEQQLKFHLNRIKQFKQQRLDWIIYHLISPRERLERQNILLQDLSKKLKQTKNTALQQAQEKIRFLKYQFETLKRQTKPIELQFNYLLDKFEEAWKRQHKTRVTQLEIYVQRLKLLSPHNTLDRGYAIIIDKQTSKPIRHVSNLISGLQVKLMLSDGTAQANLENIEKDNINCAPKNN